MLFQSTACCSCIALCFAIPSPILTKMVYEAVSTVYKVAFQAWIPVLVMTVKITSYRDGYIEEGGDWSGK